jgi:hypothetical protein
MMLASLFLGGASLLPVENKQDVWVPLKKIVFMCQTAGICDVSGMWLLYLSSLKKMKQ